MNLDNKKNLPAITPKAKRITKKKRILTVNQQRWQDRSSIFWRIKGMGIRHSSCITNEYLTPSEISKINEINKLIQELNDDYVENSRKLGFNAKNRCWCGKEAVDYIDDMWLCKEHKKFV